jgi:hypothetical protein
MEVMMICGGFLGILKFGSGEDMLGNLEFDWGYCEECGRETKIENAWKKRVRTNSSGKWWELGREGLIYSQANVNW